MIFARRRWISVRICAFSEQSQLYLASAGNGRLYCHQRGAGKTVTPDDRRARGVQGFTGDGIMAVFGAPVSELAERHWRFWSGSSLLDLP